MLVSRAKTGKKQLSDVAIFQLNLLEWYQCAGSCIDVLFLY